MNDETKPVEEFSVEEVAAKRQERKLIDAGRGPYHAAGGTTKRFIKPEPTQFIECDVFVPNQGSHPTTLGIKDTMVRKPRPPKKFGKKS